jgi:hypothetical protein
MGCTLAITGEPAELNTAAAQRAVTGHEHADTSKLRDHLRGVLADEPALSQPARPSSSPADITQAAGKARPNHRGNHHAPAPHEGHPRRRTTGR